LIKEGKERPLIKTSMATFFRPGFLSKETVSQGLIQWKSEVEDRTFSEFAY
jgi:hypothetical protein